MTLRSNMGPFFWSVRFDDGACVFLPHGGSHDHYRHIAELSEHQSIRGGSGNRASSGVCTSIGVVFSANPAGVRTASSEESVCDSIGRGLRTALGRRERGGGRHAGGTGDAA